MSNSIKSKIIWNIRPFVLKNEREKKSVSPRKQKQEDKLRRFLQVRLITTVLLKLKTWDKASRVCIWNVAIIHVNNFSQYCGTHSMIWMIMMRKMWVTNKLKPTRTVLLFLEIKRQVRWKQKAKKNQPVVKKSSTSKLKTKIKVSIDLCVPFQTTERNSTAFEKKQNKTNKSPKNRRLPVNRKVSTTTNL